MTLLCVFPIDVYVCICVNMYCMCEHVHVDVCTCMLSVYSVRLCAVDFVCMHLLLDQFFDDFLKFPKLKQLLQCSM